MTHEKLLFLKDRNVGIYLFFPSPLHFLGIKKMKQRRHCYYPKKQRGEEDK